jgi:hypothetical protein
MAESGINRYACIGGRVAAKNLPFNKDLSNGTTRWIVPLTLECGIFFFILPFLLILDAREHEIVGNGSQ